MFHYQMRCEDESRTNQTTQQTLCYVTKSSAIQFNEILVSKRDHIVGRLFYNINPSLSLWALHGHQFCIIWKLPAATASAFQQSLVMKVLLGDYLDSRQPCLVIYAPIRQSE